MFTYGDLQILPPPSPLPRHPGHPPPRWQLLLRFEVTSCFLRLAVTPAWGAPGAGRETAEAAEARLVGGGTSPCPALAAPKKWQQATPKRSQVQ